MLKQNMTDAAAITDVDQQHTYGILVPYIQFIQQTFHLYYYFSL